MSKRCEVVIQWAKRDEDIEHCGMRAVARYPAGGGGYMHLCEEHAKPHAAYAERIVPLNAPNAAAPA